MRYSFRLAEVVGHVPDPRKRPGTIKAICEYTGLDRHQVAALLKNEVKYIPLDALSKLCAYLIERGYAQAEELPGRLFGVEPEHFWELLAQTDDLRNGYLQAVREQHERLEAIVHRNGCERVLVDTSLSMSAQLIDYFNRRSTLSRAR